MENHKYHNEQILRDACYLYKIPFENAKLIRNNSNLIYDCRDKVLRLTHSEIRKIEDINVELDWLDYLGKRDLPVVKIIPSILDSKTEIIEDANGYNTFVCFEKIIGKRIPKEGFNVSHFRKLGKLTGQLHKIGNEYEEKENLKYQHWDEIMEFYLYEYLPEDDRKLKLLNETLVQEFKTYPISKENYGFIHYDIHHGNYMVHDNLEITLFDFESTCKSWFINDIATVLYYAFSMVHQDNQKDFQKLFMSRFMEGYLSENVIPKSELEKIPKFLLYRDLMVYGYLHKVGTIDQMPTNQFDAYKKRLADSISDRRSQLHL